MPTRAAKGGGRSSAAIASMTARPAHRPLGVVLMGLWVTEIDKHAIAHVFGDKPGEAGRSVGDGAVVGGEDLPQILGIKACGQRGRADEVAEHDG